MKYFLVFLYITLISNSSFADEIMKCKINDEQNINFKLEENLLSKDKIFKKVETKWKVECPCEKVINKSVSCKTTQAPHWCDGSLTFDDTYHENSQIIDFETRELKLRFHESGRLVTLKCQLVD